MFRRSKSIPVDVHLANLRASRKRWLSRMLRAANTVSNLERAIARLEKALPIEIEQAIKPLAPPPPVDHTTEVMQKLTGVVENLDIPAAFIRPKINAADEAAKAEILAAQAAKTKVKAKASSEKSKAKSKGKLKTMPLTGKAALDFIHGK